MNITATKLRENIYKLLDMVLDKGISLKIKRKGRVIVISSEKENSIFDRLEKHNAIVGDPEEIVHMDWSKEWKCDII